MQINHLSQQKVTLCIFRVSGFTRLVLLGKLRIKLYLCSMDHTQLLRAILPDVLIDNFDVARFEKTDLRFDIWLDEKKVQSYPMASESTIQSRTSRFVAVPPTFMFASASGLTRIQEKYSVTSGSCPNTMKPT